MSPELSPLLQGFYLAEGYCHAQNCGAEGDLLTHLNFPGWIPLPQQPLPITAQGELEQDTVPDSAVSNCSLTHQWSLQLWNFSKSRQPPQAREA